MPLWQRWQISARARAALRGVQAAVIGLLAAAFYRSIWVDSIHSPLALALAALGFVCLALWKLPAWVLVLGFALGGVLMGLGP